MYKRIIKTICNAPSAILNRVWSRLFIRRLSKKPTIELKGELIINGRPLIDIREGCSLCLGDGVMLNSKNKGYHINMHSPVKLLADRPQAQIQIGDHTRVHGTCIHAYQSIKIGCNCLIAANCQIFDGSGHDLSFPDVHNRIHTRGTSKPIVIEDDVWIGANSIVLPGVKIGQGSVISANSVVARDIPPLVIAGGNPAVVIKDYAPSDDLFD